MSEGNEILAEEEIVVEPEDVSADGEEDAEVAEDAKAASSDVEPSEFDEADLDLIADTAIDVLQSIFKPFDVGDITINEYEGDEGELILDVTGDDLAVLIGRHGKTLDAIQFLVSIITKRKLGYRYPVIIDVEGYKGRLRQKIESIARSAASRAITQKRDVKLRPMTPYERRIVHITLKDNPQVETESEGEGSDRHVVVFPII